MKTPALALCLLCLAPSFAKGQDTGAADDAAIEKIIQDALASYRAGEAQQAVERLHEAIARIEQSQKIGLASHLPPVPKGWDAGEVDSQSMSFAAGGQSGSQFLQIRRDYWPVESDGSKGPRVNVTITNAPMMVQAQKAASAVYKNPQFLKSMQADPNRKVELVEEGEWFGWKIIEKEKQGTVTAFCNNCLVTVNGDENSGVETIWKGFDLEGLAKSSTPEKGR